MQSASTAWMKISRGAANVQPGWEWKRWKGKRTELKFSVPFVFHPRKWEYSRGERVTSNSISLEPLIVHTFSTIAFGSVALFNIEYSRVSLSRNSIRTSSPAIIISRLIRFWISIFPRRFHSSVRIANNAFEFSIARGASVSVLIKF